MKNLFKKNITEIPYSKKFWNIIMNLKEDYKMSNKFNKGDIVEVVNDSLYSDYNVKIKKV